MTVCSSSSKLLSSPAVIVTKRFCQAAPWKNSSGDCLQPQRDAFAPRDGRHRAGDHSSTMNLIRRGDSMRVTLKFFFQILGRLGIAQG